MLTTDNFAVSFSVSSTVDFAVGKCCSRCRSRWLLFIKGVYYGPPDPIQGAFALEPPVG